MERRAFVGRLDRGMALLLGLALIKVAVHFALNGSYNFMRDELYFMSCGEHLDWGYVDIGPLAMWLGRLSRVVLGDTPFALRFFPALAGGVALVLTGLVARELGGGWFAQGLAGLAYLIAPVYLGAGNILALPSFEPVFWTLAALVVMQIFRTGNSRLWVWVGVIAGLGLLNKPSMVFWGVGLAIGLALTRQRRFFRDKWLWLGGLAAFVVASPYILWQIPRGWPTLQFLIGMNMTVMRRISALEFLIGQVFYVHPLNLPIWLAGLGWYFFSKRGAAYRPLGWLYATVFLFLLIAHSKVYYLCAAYPMLLGAGALVVEHVLERRALRWPLAAIPTALAAGGLATAPVVLPILPIERVDGYVGALTLGLMRHSYELTGTFHDQFGWEEQAAMVARVYHALSPEERTDCVIFASNFGRAGAIDFYGPKYGLPKATSIHQNYYFWGPPERMGPVTIVVGVERERLDQFFGTIETVATIEGEHCMPFEREVPIYLCRTPKTTLEDAWPALRPIAFLN